MKKLILFIGSVLPLLAAAQGISFYEGTWKEAQAKAKKENKLIFVDYYATWCGPCKYMSASVFTRPAVGDYFNTHFVSLKIDAEKEYPELVESAEIEAYPTLIFYTPSGEIFARFEGGQTAEDLLSTARKITDFDKNRKAWEAEPSHTGYLRDYLFVLNSQNPEKARSIMNAYLDTVPSSAVRKPEIWELVQAFETRANSRFFLYTVENVLYFLQEHEASYPDYYSTVMQNLLRLAVGQKSEFMLEQYIRISETVLKVLNNPEMNRQWPSQKRETEAFYYRETEQYALYLAKTDTLVKQYYGDPEQIGDAIAEVCESVPAAQGGQYVVSWARLLYETNPEAYNAYILAYALRYAGNKKEALHYARKALDEATDEDDKQVFLGFIAETEKMK